MILSKKFFLIFLFLILSQYSVLFPNQSINELEKKILNLSGTEKVDYLNKLSREYWLVSDQKALEVAQQALSFARKINYLRGEIISLANMAYSNARLYDFEKALHFSGKSLNLAENSSDNESLIYALSISGEISDRLNMPQKSLSIYLRLLKIQEITKDYEGVINSIFLIGATYQKLGIFDKALSYFKEYLEHYKKTKNDREIANGLRYVGSVYWEKGEFGVSSTYYFKSLEILEKKVKDNRLIAKTYQKLGRIYHDWKNIPRSLEYLNKSLAIYQQLEHSQSNIIILHQDIGLIYTKLRQFDRAEKLFKDSLAKTNLKNKVLLSEIYSNLGFLYEKKKHFDLSLTYYHKSLRIKEKIKNKSFVASSYRSIGLVYSEVNEYKKSIFYLQKSLKYFEEFNDINIVTRVNFELAGVYFQLGEYKKAYEHLAKHVELKDKIFTEDSAKKVAEMETKYETEKKEQEIEMLTQDNRIQVLMLERQKMVRYVIILFALLLLLLMVIFFRKYRHLLVFWKKKNLVGHYKIMDRIASGGMGVVYKAHDLLDNSKEIAIKVLREEYFADEEQRKRFKNEASIIGQFDHPNIVKVVERGETDGNLYIAMELLDGPTLGEIIKTEGGFGMALALDIMLQTCDALSKIHSKNIIHRDLKPENIMLVEREGKSNVVKLLDFGLSKTQSLTRVTRTGMILGTIFYLAPEQVLDQELTPATDIYSLGIIFFEMLAGQKPFAGESEENIIMQILETQPPGLITLRPHIPAPINDLIKTMTAKAPNQRPQLPQVITILKNSLNSITQQ